MSTSKVIVKSLDIKEEYFIEGLLGLLNPKSRGIEHQQF